MNDRLISLNAALTALGEEPPVWYDGEDEIAERNQWRRDVAAIKALPSTQPDADKYEYHYDHTDCIWYRPEARNRCPVTCAQYRDGWNDAMNYIFRDGQGYRPYRRDERYER